MAGPRRLYGLAALLGGVLFVASDCVAFLIEPPDGFDRAPTWEAWATWTALSLISFALLQVALVGLYRSQRSASGILTWSLSRAGFILASGGTAAACVVIVFYAFAASPATPRDPVLLGVGPPAAFVLYFPLFSLGWFLIGAALLRSSIRPRWAPPLLMVGSVLALHPHPITSTVFGVAVVSLGLPMLRKRFSSRIE